MWTTGKLQIYVEVLHQNVKLDLAQVLSAQWTNCDTCIVFNKTSCGQWLLSYYVVDFLLNWLYSFILLWDGSLHALIWSSAEWSQRKSLSVGVVSIV
jgi:hypothetical protein